MALIKSIETIYSRSKSLLQPLGQVGFYNLVRIRNFTRNFCVASNVPQQISSEEVNKKLMEFFDDSKNWGASEVKVGRSWKKDELRLKSNVDLHKLWYVLLKEKNMLLSMEHESKEKMRLFPNPERLDKVDESMSNLEEIVRERNKAYFLLETGEDGERPGREAISRLGLPFYYKMKEYAVPRHKNLRWWREISFGYENDPSVRRFLKLYREKLYLAKKRQRTRNFNHVQHLLRRYPDVDMEAVCKQYPEVDIEKARQGKRARGNHEFNS